MTGGTVYRAGWSLDEVPWASFDPSKVDPELLAAIKAASLVELNSPDYVGYLKRVFSDASPEILASIDQWGDEEAQHGRALGRWAEMADPSFDFKSAFARFQAGYRPPHLVGDDLESIRGSRRGEMIARCVVESGTSSFYSAIREATDEPVLKDIAGRIAADEFRHYKLFYETLQAQDEPQLPFWRRVYVALSRVNEYDDDELAYAYYSATVPVEREADTPYRRDMFAGKYHAKAMTLYRQHHVRKLVQMVAKAVGANPQGKLATFTGAVLWQGLRMKIRVAAAMAPAAAA
jgi:hypothetical protein